MILSSLEDGHVIVEQEYLLACDYSYANACVQCILTCSRMKDSIENGLSSASIIFCVYTIFP